MEHQAKIEDAEYFFQRITDISPVVLYIFDLELMTNVWVNQPIGSLLGRSAGEIAQSGDTLLEDGMHPDDWKLYRGHFRKLRKLEPGERAVFEYRMRHADGKWRWLRSEDLSYETDAYGNTIKILGCALDITARKEIELREAMLHRELQHRLQNLMSIVGSIVRLSGRGAETAEQVVDRASSRIEALGWATTLSFKTPGGGPVKLADLLEKAFGPHMPAGQVTVDADKVSASPENAESLALLLHEMITNAVKYGALSGGGALTLSFKTQRTGVLQLIWDEKRGPDDPCVNAPDDAGFGLGLIRHNVEAMGGSVDFDWRPEGLLATITTGPGVAL